MKFIIVRRVLHPKFCPNYCLIDGEYLYYNGLSNQKLIGILRAKFYFEKIYIANLRKLSQRFQVKKADKLLSNEPTFWRRCSASDSKSGEVGRKFDLFWLKYERLNFYFQFQIHQHLHNETYNYTTESSRISVQGCIT